MLGTSLAIILIAAFVYDPQPISPDMIEPIPFEWRYLEELEEMTDRSISDEELAKLADYEVDEETPDGRVIMSYDHDAQAFAYYADEKQIQFKYLDALARQFTVKHDVKDICVNYGYEYIDVTAKESQAPMDDVFVKPKAVATRKKRTKIANRFSHRGSLKQKWMVIEEPERLTFADFKKNGGLMHGGDP